MDGALLWGCVCFDCVFGFNCVVVVEVIATVDWLIYLLMRCTPPCVLGLNFLWTDCWLFGFVYSGFVVFNSLFFVDWFVLRLFVYSIKAGFNSNLSF